MRTNAGLLLTTLVVSALSACSGTQGANDTPSAASPPTPTPSSPSPAPAPAPPQNSPAPYVYPPPLRPLQMPPVATISCSPCKRIAFVSSRDGNAEIYSVNADGTVLTRLTFNDAWDGEPSWSPDGRRIAFTSERDDATGGLYVMDADGSNVVRMVPATGGVGHPAWSPDGTRIAYASFGAFGSVDLWTVTVDSNQASLLFSAPGYDAEPSWSPDGTRLVLASDWIAFDFGTELFLINPDGTGFRSLLDGKLSNDLYHARPCWSPNSAMIAMTTYREVAFDRYDVQIGLVSADDSGYSPLISAGDGWLSLGWSKCTWSPDGTMIAYAFQGIGQQDIYWVRADGSARGTIITNGWSPDWQR